MEFGLLIIIRGEDQGSFMVASYIYFLPFTSDDLRTGGTQSCPVCLFLQGNLNGCILPRHLSIAR